MNLLFGLIVFTSNILGSFNDPFEFDGDYGNEINPIRDYVFEQVVSKEALITNLTDEQIIKQLPQKDFSAKDIQEYRQKLIAEAFQDDLQHGPTLNELMPHDLIELLFKKQQELEGFSESDYLNFLYFIDRYGDQKVFSFFRHAPPDFLSLDKILHDAAARKGLNFDLPILSSSELLKGKNSLELKANLLKSLFTIDTLEAVKTKDKLKNVIEKLDPAFLQKYLGLDADNADLAVFTSPAGQMIFYWLYQSLNLHLISENPSMISEINRVKETFLNTLGNPAGRAVMFRDSFISSGASLIFTQESDAMVPQLLEKDGLFHPVDNQNSNDGTLVFLRGDIWEPNYEIIAIDDYEGYKRGRLNLILATMNTGERFLLASSHGNSTRAEDGRLQITKIMEKFNQLNKLPENKNLQLVIGIDANTKSQEDIRLLREHLDMLGLIATNTGPTTVKKRMVTTQHSKAGRFAVDEEDYIIILKPENGGIHQMTNPTIGFKEDKPDPTIPLPNKANPSDHYPVGVTLSKKQQD